MRIRQPPSSTEQNARLDPRANKLLLLAVVLGVVLIAAATWYQSEGRDVVRLPFSDWFAGEKEAEPVVKTNDLPVLHLDIAPSDYRELERHRDEALQEGFLYREDEDGTRAKRQHSIRGGTRASGVAFA